MAYTDHEVNRGAVNVAETEGEGQYEVMYKDPDTVLRSVQQFQGKHAPHRDLPPSPCKLPVNPTETSADDSSSSVRAAGPGGTKIADSAAEGHYY